MTITGKPRFYCIEGLDGCGKSTQINLLLEELARRGWPSLRIREPGGTEISEKIRSIILNPEHSAMSPTAELLLYSAARAQLIHEIVSPALQQHKIVIADRFAWSTLAYQGYGRRIPMDLIESLTTIAVGGHWPELTFILDIPVETFRERARLEGRSADRLEQEHQGFFERVRDGYRQIAAANPQHCVLLDGTRSKTEIHNEILQIILPRLSA